MPQRQSPLPRVPLGLVGLMERVDGVIEAFAPDETHGVERPAIGVLPQAVDRHNSWMFEPAGDLCLLKEPRPALRLVGVTVLDFLQGHIAVELFVVSHEDGPQPSFGMRSEDTEAEARG